MIRRGIADKLWYGWSYGHISSPLGSASFVAPRRFAPSPNDHLDYFLSQLAPSHRSFINRCHFLQPKRWMVMYGFYGHRTR